MQSFLGLEVGQLDGCIKLHLDKYIQELIAEYQLVRPKFLKPKKVPMSPGLVLDTNDFPETPDPVVQKQYRSIVAKIQFAAHWIRFDISNAAAQLARFCAYAGPSHWAALMHLIGYLVHQPSFKLTYSKDLVGGLDGYTDSDWGNILSR
jgi:hypothetical protein